MGGKWRQARLSRVIKNRRQIIVFPGRDIVSSAADGVKAELRLLVEQAPEELVIDLSGVEMVDSMGIGVLIATFNSLTKAGGVLKIINASEYVYEIFVTMRLTYHFSIQKADPKHPFP
jgi:anti-sigma B factor antagonist